MKVNTAVAFGSFYTQPGQLDPAGLAAFDRILDLAAEAGIYLHPTGPQNQPSVFSSALRSSVAPSTTSCRTRSRRRAVSSDSPATL
jgi:hypothetical protein